MSNPGMMGPRYILILLCLLCTGGLAVLALVLLLWLWRKKAEPPPGWKPTHPEEEAVESPSAAAPVKSWPAAPWEAPPEPPAAEAPEVEAPAPPTATAWPAAPWEEPPAPAEPEAAQTPAPSPKPEAKPRTRASTAVPPDDLTSIAGIGPRVAAALNAAAIQTFAQLAEADVERLRSVLVAAGWRYMDPGSWPQQAAVAARGDWDGLKALQDGLKGGREG